MSTAAAIKKSNPFLPLLLFVILSDVVCDNYVFHTFDNLSRWEELFLFVGLLVLQIIAAPIQSGFSDFFCRKKSLISSIFFSLLSIVFVFLYNDQMFTSFAVFILMALAKGGFGNSIPLARASIADTQEKNFRFSFGLSSAMFAVGYLMLIYADKYLEEIQSNLYVMSVFCVLLCICMMFFKDARDRRHQKKHTEITPGISFIALLLSKEVKEIIHFLKLPHIRVGLLSFFLWEISLYSILLLYVDFNIKGFSSTAESMMIGYLVGIAVLKFCDKVSDSTMLKWGYYFSVLSLPPIFMLNSFDGSINYFVISTCYFFHTIGNAFLCPTFFAILSKENGSHNQGKIYGLIDSVDTLSFLVSSVFVICYKSFDAGLLFVVLFSFLSIVFSWFPYRKFEKTRPKI